MCMRNWAIAAMTHDSGGALSAADVAAPGAP
jgi:hypothetical protein